MAVRLRGRRWRAERERRRLEEAEDPAVVDDASAVGDETPGEAGISGPGESGAPTSRATDSVGQDDGIVSIVPATDTAEQLAVEEPSVKTRTTEQASRLVEPTPSATPSSRPSNVRPNMARRVVVNGLDGLDEMAIEGGDHTTRPLPRIIAVANQKGGWARRPRL